jgi:predicted GIY-YIG superfamily endonuclease
MLRQWYVYILACADGTFYTGMTMDPERRLDEHNAGLDPAAYTFTRRPVRLVWAETLPRRHEAIAREHQVKGWSRAKKLALIRNDWDEVQAIVREERRSRESTPLPSKKSPPR